MIHHNPGEALFDSAFLDPGHLKAYGYNAQAFKHINTVVTFEAIAPGIFPATPEEGEWLRQTCDRIRREISDAKAAGLSVFYHIDLFVLPTRILEHFGSRLLDSETGRISIDQPFTLELHRVMLDEIFSVFPEVDGLIIRVGETYLFDTPYHSGNGAVQYSLENPVEEKIRQFVTLLQFLRQEVCETYGKTVIHRTWDTWPNRFHADRDFYVRVTNQIQPHEKLIFSVKHTQVDFHRWVEFNPCLMQGRHRQVVEVQCQREYEGKGAYPNYIARGVIEGFEEQAERKGLGDIQDHPLYAGIYTWSRGGGWYGPYVDRSNELWCDLNAYVVIQWGRNPGRSEEAIFRSYAEEVLGMSEQDAEIFRRIALLSSDAVLKGKCCAVYDRREKEQPGYPTNQWMRDDVLQGFDRLEGPFQYLQEMNAVDAALLEKAESVEIWQQMRDLCGAFSPDMDVPTQELVLTTVEYGLRFFRSVEAAWRALLTGWCQERGGSLDAVDLDGALADFDRSWAHYQDLPADYSHCASLYRLFDWSWPGQPPPPGLAGALDHFRNLPFLTHP